MKEFEKQIVIFGNFEYLDFNNVMKIKDFFESYDMYLEGTPDFPKDLQFRDLQPRIITEPPLIRPMFINKAKSKRVVFGTFRINIEEYDNSIHKYDEFSLFAERLFSILFSDFGIKPNRLAVNGRLVQDLDKLTSYYEKFISNISISGDIGSFGFNVEKIEYVEELKSNINKILNIQKANVGLIGKPGSDCILTSYDFNTIIQTQVLYTFEDYQTFKHMSDKYRNSIISDVMKL
ncbi:MAG: hypothetical protein RBQ97_12090 [Acholeplasma sp.]|nr:hypothetical protein [Acholeplasma sp.]